MQNKYTINNEASGIYHNEIITSTDVISFKNSFEYNLGKKDFVLYIVGPTASGKSALAHHIAKKYNGAIICADSRTVYKGMDIGTAKPTKKERSEVDYYCLDVVEPSQRFTVADFKKCAEEAIAKVKTKGQLPIVVGGSGLYIDALLFDYSFRNQEQNKTSLLENMTTDELIKRASEYKKLSNDDKGNRRRIIKIIETKGQQSTKKDLTGNVMIIGLNPSKDVLLRRIEDRIRDMFHRGVVDEAKALAGKYGWDTEAMTGNVYRVAHDVLDEKIDESDAITLCVQADKKLVKKQLTWFRRNRYIQWFESVEKVLSVI